MLQDCAPRRCTTVIKRLESREHRKRAVGVQLPKGRLRLLCSQVSLRIWGPGISLWDLGHKEGTPALIYGSWLEGK